METTIITWNFTNWITVVLMVAIVYIVAVTGLKAYKTRGGANAAS